MSWTEKAPGLVVVEAALLIEANWTSLADQVWVVTSEEAHVVSRLTARNQLSEESIRAPDCIPDAAGRARQARRRYNQ